MVDRKVSVTLDARVAPYIRGTQAATAATRSWVRELESADSRMSTLVQTGLALAPALVPIGATVTPVITSLTSQLGFAALAAGTTVAAFNGVGDALDALNKYQLDPTEANLEALEEAMGNLPKSARQFVRFVDSELMPALDALQDVAADGILPGAQSGIEDLMTRLPQFRDLVEEVADTTGDLMADTGASVAQGEWDDFLAYLTTEARPTLESLAATTGNIFEGVADSLMALDPVTDHVTEGIEGLTEKWAELDPSDYDDFVTYLERVGPKVADTLGATAKAIGALTMAAAPVGEVALPVIEALAVALTAVAESPAGPPLIGAAAGISAISRAVALYNAANGSAMMGLLQRGSKEGGKAGAGFRTAAAGIGVLALSMTDLDEQAGFANTAMFGTLGLIAGPWGAAIGTSAGLLLDMKERADGASEALDGLEDVLDSGDAERLEQRLSDLKAELDDLENITGFGDFWDDILGAADTSLPGSEDNSRVAQLKRSIADVKAEMGDLDAATRNMEMAKLLGGDLEITSEALQTATQSADAFRESLLDLNATLEGRANLRDYEKALDDFTRSIRENGDVWDTAAENMNVADKARENQEALDGIVESAIAVSEGLEGIERVNFIDSTARQLRKLAKEHDIPRKQVQVLLEELEALGAAKPTAKPDVDDEEAKGKLAKLEERLDKYGLTTETAKAALKDLASGRIDDVQGLIAKYGLTQAEAQALLDDQASGTIKSVRALLAALNGTVATTTIRTVRIIEEHRDRSRVNQQGANIGGTPQANGGIRENGRRAMADGGFGEDGRYYPRVSQIVPGGANILWGEEETGWEAYISGKPGMEARNLDVWIDAGRRLGALEATSGGELRSIPAPTAPARALAGTGGGGASRVVVEVGDVTVRGTVDTPWGPANVEGVARAVAREEIDAASEWETDQRAS